MGVPGRGTNDITEPLIAEPASPPPASAIGAQPAVEDDDVSIKVDDGPKYAEVTFWDIFRYFNMMGWLAFGGPAAHVAMFQKRFVERLRWMSNQVFLEMFALGQCLPGPTSTQLSFALGVVKKGVWGGLLSGCTFQYPGALIMTIVGVGAADYLVDPPPWLKAMVAGLSATGVALVASSAKGLLLKSCTDKVNAILGTLSAVAAIYWHPPWLFPTIIAVGAVVTIIANRNKDMTLKGDEDDFDVKKLGINMLSGAMLVLLWLGILIPVLILVRTLDYDHRKEAKALDWFEAFYRTGSIIYGGGQVVLPMLLNDMVKYDCDTPDHSCVEKPFPESWMTSQQFYAGLGVVQALPGPLFNFAAYLGAIVARNFGQSFLLGAAVAWLGLFGPGIILMFGALPYWKRFRKWQVYRRALPGMNSTSVGLILASVAQMTLGVLGISPFPTASVCIGILSFTAVDTLKIFEPFVILCGGLLAMVAWAAKMR